MHEEVLMILFGMPLAAFIVFITFHSLVRICCHWRDVSLKIRLAERGMSAVEIEQVVLAGRGGAARLRRQLASEGKPPQRVAMAR